MLLLFFFWILIDRKVALLLLVCILLGFNNISSVFAWNFNQKRFVLKKNSKSIRIIGYNVNGFDIQENKYDTLNNRQKILNYILKQNADIICLQDFNDFYNPLLVKNIEYFQDTQQYKYHYLGSRFDMQQWGLSEVGIAIFSKYPIKNIQHIVYKNRTVSECFITADITINEITRRLIVTHFQSMYINAGFVKKTKDDPNEDSTFIYSGSSITKLNYFLPYHAQQANTLKEEMDKSPYPVILSIDMNEVPSSYCYHHIRGKLNDVFLHEGFGFGRTYYKISPTLRIDYLMTDPSIEVVQYKKDDIFLSDHYPQVMDLKW